MSVQFGLLIHRQQVSASHWKMAQERWEVVPTQASSSVHKQCLCTELSTWVQNHGSCVREMLQPVAYDLLVQTLLSTVVVAPLNPSELCSLCALFQQFWRPVSASKEPEIHTAVRQGGLLGTFTVISWSNFSYNPTCFRYRTGSMEVRESLWKV